jgi:hippurate hydrolase
MGKTKKLMSDAVFKRLVSLRRKIHKYPEPAFMEHRTAAAILQYLDKLGLPYRSGLGGTGIVAMLEADGPTIALRADMDALPIQEKTGLPFSSKLPGCMHACGHDGHIAIMLGAAELLSKNPPKGTVKFLFQPAEEGGAGALKLIEAGALDDVQMIFGGHIEGRFDVGQIALRPSVETSFTDELIIRIVGKGGHAARPHETVDAILVASLFVTSLQNIVSRSVNPTTPTVISIGSFHSGTVFNAISDEATLKGTLRNTDKKTRQLVIRKVRKTAEALGILHDAAIDVEIIEGYPQVVNHPVGYALARDLAEEMFAKENVINLGKPSMGGEDFAYYLEKVPGCFIRLGARVVGGAGGTIPAAHSSTFDFNEEVIRVGGAYFAELARKSIESLREGR